jgi:hypothetical protein
MTTDHSSMQLRVSVCGDRFAGEIEFFFDGGCGGRCVISGMLIDGGGRW